MDVNGSSVGPPSSADSDAADRIAPGTAGASARLEHQRRRAARLQRDRDRYGSFVGGIVSRTTAPAHEAAWRTGAEGEESVARSLARRAGDHVILLHDRRFPGSRANIDHIAVTPTGVWVVDSKRYKGAIAVRRPFFGSAKLTIGGRDQTKLLTGVRRQAELVANLLGHRPSSVEVTAALCFVDAEMPLAGLRPVDGVELLRPKGLAKRLRAARGDGSMDAAREVAARLSAALPPS